MIIYNYKGLNGVDSKCGLEVHKNLVIITEIAEGTSVACWINFLAEGVCQKFKINPKELIWIEHTPADLYPNGNDETFDLVQFNLDKDNFFNPRWIQITPEVVDALRGMHQ